MSILLIKQKLFFLSFFPFFGFNFLFSHKADQPYWQNLNAQGWRDEMTSMRDMIAKYALVPKEEVIGNVINAFQTTLIAYLTSLYIQACVPRSFRAAATSSFRCW
jgi:hypothetical protein